MFFDVNLRAEAGWSFSMKVLLITGSPREGGASSILAGAFEKGALSAGHSVFRFDAGLRKVAPCTVCEHCHTGGDRCIIRDDMDELMPHLLESEALVFASPIYYYDVTAQLRCVIGRFYACRKDMHRPRASAFLVVSGDREEESAAGSIANYHALVSRLRWHDAGVIAARGIVTADEMRKSDFPHLAGELGRNIGTI